MVKNVKMQSGRPGIVIACDRCSKSPYMVYDVDGRDVCYSCLLKLFDEEDGVCCSCGREDACYNVDGELFCDDCLTEQFPRTTEDGDEYEPRD